MTHLFECNRLCAKSKLQHMQIKHNKKTFIFLNIQFNETRVLNFVSRFLLVYMLSVTQLQIRGTYQKISPTITLVARHLVQELLSDTTQMLKTL